MVGVSIFFDLLVIFSALIAIYSKRKKSINMFNAFSAGYCLYFGIIPILLKLLDLRAHVESKYIVSLNEVKDTDFIIASITAIVAYLMFVTIYNLFPLAKSTKKHKVLYDDSRLKDVSFYYARNIGYLTLIIGGLSFGVIIDQLGGLQQAFKLSEILRSYGNDNGIFINRSVLFLRTLTGILVASPFAFWIAYQHRRSKVIGCFFVLSFLLSLIYLLFNAGRTPLLLLIIPFYFIFLKRHFRYPWITLLVTATVGLIVLPLLDNLFYYLSYGIGQQQDDSALYKIIAEFSFPYVNTLNVQRMNDIFGYRYGVDYLTWIINIIPMGILSKLNLSKISVSHDFTSSFYDPYNQGMGGVPTDIITFGFRELGFLGVFIHFFLVAVVCSIIDRRITNVQNLDKYYVGLFKVASLFFMYPAYADLDPIARGRMDFLIILCLIIFMASRTNACSVDQSKMLK